MEAEGTHLKAAVLGLFWLLGSASVLLAQEGRTFLPSRPPTQAEQEIINLSKDKWLWMSERKVDALDALFHEDAFFVHMGATMSKSQELGVIKSGGIQYKQADIQEVSVRIIGSTAILLNRIRLVAVVGGNEVVNPFVVTEVYVRLGGAWRLASLSFTRLTTP
jgi:hypothetical protein